MNNKGQVVLFAFMLFVIIVVFALGIAFPTRQIATQSMTSMDCSNSSISDSTKAGCYMLDISPAAFILALVALGGIVLTAKIYLS